MYAIMVGRKYLARLSHAGETWTSVKSCALTFKCSEAAEHEIWRRQLEHCCRIVRLRSAGGAK